MKQQARKSGPFAIPTICREFSQVQRPAPKTEQAEQPAKTRHRSAEAQNPLRQAPTENDNADQHAQEPFCTRAFDADS